MESFILMRHLCLKTCRPSRLKFSSASSVQRRVVVTGFGVVSPLGVGVETNWKRLLNGEIGITKIEDKFYDDIPCKIAACVPQNEFEVEKRFSKSEIRTLSLSTLYALTAAEEALSCAKWKPKTESERIATGVAIGSGMVDLTDIVTNGVSLRENGYKRVSPHFITRILVNMPAGNVSIRHGLKGPNHSVSTACTTGLHAIGDSYNFIKRGAASVMLCGGTEAAITPLSLAAFCRIRALCCDSNETPEKASRPFDETRNGFVMGEGCALLVLEDLEHALRRNANIFAEVLGYGVSGDANHITAPNEDGTGAQQCMNFALRDAGICLTDVSHINCHATSTPLGDAAEVSAIRKLFGSHFTNIFLASCKGQIGHLLGAAGSIEAMFTVLSCFHSKIPPTANLNKCLDSNVAVYSTEQCWKSNSRRIAVKNSFGFGGTNASVVFSNFTE
ncbi:3-oxoacyl-[acyl-carrier-protein] synthase-like protein [Leptotrombidium deliense]|uniref:3-oxoacyl-[acyl-carrier-protein] synthase n=1 Tax=Leptotrombidium deliense TaxID=299467 RepID=A0A443S5H9_9ACAR|nr:3-oxoacyl-[acyl-carrier-protein] synthase-like protein [Leptotrombidium deliense]